ncbi:MAG: hypothetical protein INQ03_17495 [Candidatus Heimdallarchaeota archaeon]|nr:hypothetical protein [Candidatus Heimdallarchaeota archaeon]
MDMPGYYRNLHIFTLIVGSLGLTLGFAFLVFSNPMIDTNQLDPDGQRFMEAVINNALRFMGLVFSFIGSLMVLASAIALKTKIQKIAWLMILLIYGGGTIGLFLITIYSMIEIMGMGLFTIPFHLIVPIIIGAYLIYLLVSRETLNFIKEHPF